jgi:hypothetical protein
MVTFVPMGPLEGENEVIDGTCAITEFNTITNRIKIYFFIISIGSSKDLVL